MAMELTSRCSGTVSALGALSWKTRPPVSCWRQWVTTPHRGPGTPHRGPGRVRGAKDVGTEGIEKQSLNLDAEENGKVSGTYTPLTPEKKRTGFKEEESVAQTNIDPVEPTEKPSIPEVANPAVGEPTEKPLITEVAKSAVAEPLNNAAVGYGFGLLIVAGAAAFLLGVGKDVPVTPTAAVESSDSSSSVADSNPVAGVEKSLFVAPDLEALEAAEPADTAGLSAEKSLSVAPDLEALEAAEPTKGPTVAAADLGALDTVKPNVGAELGAAETPKSKPNTERTDVPKRGTGITLPFTSLNKRR